jgi:hypothetical protein
VKNVEARMRLDEDAGEVAKIGGFEREDLQLRSSSA